MDERKNSEAKLRANKKYNDKAYDRINIIVAKGKKDVIQTHSTTHGDKSLNGFINRAIDRQMERDNNIVPPQPTANTQLTDEEIAHIEKRRAVMAQFNGQ